eukprot:12393777-Karenia_brevis.AAC.1
MVAKLKDMKDMNKRADIKAEVSHIKTERAEEELHRASERIQILEMKVDVEEKQAALEAESAVHFQELAHEDSVRNSELCSSLKALQTQCELLAQQS